jgi:hypothetical protein
VPESEVKRRRSPAVAAALLLAALAAAGCGLGPGADLGGVELRVTREYGSVPVLENEVGSVTESDTVMRVLEDEADVATRYGGGYVQSINGVGGTERGGQPYDWFFYVDGVESPVGAADYSLAGGERVWWDYRDWKATNTVPAVVGSFPAPLAGGYEGEGHPVVVDCQGGGAACGATRSALQGEGVTISSGSPRGAIRVLVGPWSRLRSNQAAALLEGGPAESGIFAGFAPGPGGTRLQGLDPEGNVARTFGADAGLVAATRLFGGAPVWLVTGADAAGVEAAAGALDEAKLRDHYAVVVEAGAAEPLPVLSR